MTASTVFVDPFAEFLDNASDLPTSIPQETALYIPTVERLPYIFLQPGKETILGRGDSFSVQQPDVDLSLYQAVEKGVSRIHAAIEWLGDTAVLTDLDSRNGTSLNGIPLTAHQSYILQDRDEICLGELVIHILFG